MIQTQCPTSETLRLWTNGESDEATANELAEHLRNCTECQQVLAGLDDRNSDSLVQQLKAADPLLEFREELDCQQASILAMGAITGQAMEDTHTAMPVFPKEMDDYRLLELIASGGMGKVYRAHHQRLGRDVAIKIISGRRLADANASLRFEQEIRALGRLSHPNIVAALDARQADGSPILIMEYVDGLDLSQIVKRLGALPAPSVAAIGRAVAAAIAYASSNGLVHRDIKPSNIMINGKGEVKVLDLGLARIQLDGHVAPEWTGTGLAVGTPDYMSPEQINDSQTINSQSDLYSLGCTLYRLLTGQPPYGGSKYRSNFEKLAAHVSDDPIRLPNTKGQYPAQLVSIIERLLSKSPEKRADSAQAVALELEKLSEGADLVGLLGMARKLQAVDTSTTPSSPQLPQPRLASGSGRIGSILRWTAALGGIPIGILFGIWLTIKNPDGSENKVQLPGNANASVDNKGNVQVDVSKQESALLGSTAASSIALDIGSLNQLQNPTSQPDVSDQEISGLMTTNASNQPLYRGHTFDEWAAVLPSERSVEMQKVIVDGIIGLAESQEQKRRATKLILEKCRTLGGFSIGGDGDSGGWMQLVNKKMEDQRLYQLFPHPFIEEATAELSHANERSFLAILFICQGAPYEKFIDESDRGNKELSTNCHELVSALHNAYERLKPANNFPKGYSVDVINHVLAIASQLDVPYAKLGPGLQTASKDAWDKLVQTKLEPIGNANKYVQGCSWLPYWKTLPQQENRKAFVLQWFATHSVYPPHLLRFLLENFGTFNSEEQTAICGLLARKYQAYFYGYDSFNWTDVIKCLKRSSRLASANIDELQEIVQARRVNGGMGASVRSGIDVSPERVAELLGVPLPPSDNNAPKRIAPPKGSNSQLRQVEGNQDAELNNWVKASESSDKPMFRGFAFDTWLKALENERDAKAQLVAGEAVLTLAESSEEKLAAVKAVLRASRELGGIHVEGNPDDYSAKWMAMLHAKLDRFFPDLFLEAALKEVLQANKQSVYAILTICRKVGNERFIEAGFNSSGPITSPAPGWKELVKELSSFEDRVGPTLTAEVRQYLLSEICGLADHVDLPYSQLDPKLQAESKRLWGAAVNKATFYNAGNLSEVGTAWLPYWFTLPQTANHKPFMVRAVFANLDHALMASQKVFAHFEQLTPQEQSEICEFVCERYEDFYLTSWNNTEMWQQLLDCLRRCSTLDRSNIDAAAQLITDQRTEHEFNIKTTHSISRPKSLNTLKFRQLLGLPPKAATTGNQNGTVTHQAPVNKLDWPQPANGDADLKALMSASDSGKPLYRGYPFDAWVKALDADRSEDMQLQAEEAVITLAESPEEKLQAAKIILRKSRELGGYLVGNDTLSQKWMKVLRDNAHALFPDAFLSAAIEETPQANSKSYMTILRLCNSSLREVRSSEQGQHFIDPVTIKSPLWTKLVAELLKAPSRPQLTLLEDSLILAMAVRLHIPYEQLDLKLQQESKRKWEELLKTNIEAMRAGGMLEETIRTANWLPYWETLPQSDNQKAFLLRLLFVRELNARTTVPLSVLKHFEQLTAEEQTAICEVLSEKFKNKNTHRVIWKAAFDCMRRCSTLEKSNLDEADAIAVAMTEEVVNSNSSIFDSTPTPPKEIVLDVNKFRKLLNLPPEAGAKVGTKNNNSSQSDSPVADLSQKVVSNSEGNSQASQADNVLSWVTAGQSSSKALYHGFDLDTWLKALGHEQSIDLACQAGQAVMTVAASEEEKKSAAKAILIKSRQLGGFKSGENSDSEKWMTMLNENVYRMFPEPLLSEAAIEAQQANKNSLLAILNVCLYATNKINYGEGLTDQQAAAWHSLIAELSSASERVIVEVPSAKHSNSLLAQTLILSQRAAIPFKQLDERLQSEAKRLWVVAKEEPMKFWADHEFLSAPNTPWLSYWMSLPQSQNDKAFMTTAMFANLDGVRFSSTKIIANFEKFSPQEQQLVCEALADRYRNIEFNAYRQRDLWAEMFDCLKRCSDFDQPKIDRITAAFKRRSDASHGGRFPDPPTPDEFRQLLGLTAKAKPASTAGANRGN